MSEERPEYVKCITSKPGFNGITKSLCGRVEGWMFVDLAHVEAISSRLVPCLECLNIATNAAKEE